MEPTGADFIAALEKKHGTKPAIKYTTLEETISRQKHLVATTDDNFALLQATFHIRAAKGEAGVTPDVHEVEGYSKKTIFDFIR